MTSSCCIAHKDFVYESPPLQQQQHISRFNEEAWKLYETVQGQERHPRIAFTRNNKVAA
jgi:hypothetical protein